MVYFHNLVPEEQLHLPELAFQSCLWLTWNRENTARDETGRGTKPI
jgi:hypothetical protein